MKQSLCWTNINAGLVKKFYRRDFKAWLLTRVYIQVECHFDEATFSVNNEIRDSKFFGLDSHFPGVEMLKEGVQQESSNKNKKFKQSLYGYF